MGGIGGEEDKENLQNFFNFFKGNPQLSRHIKLNATNTALLLQELTQKYQKLTD